jgi:hypothetical protein
MTLMCCVPLQEPGLLEHSYFEGLEEKPMYVVLNGAEGALTEKPLVVDQASCPCFACTCLALPASSCIAFILLAYCAGPASGSNHAPV